jgi:hypothetical protein
MRPSSIVRFVSLGFLTAVAVSAACTSKPRSRGTTGAAGGTTGTTTSASCDTQNDPSNCGACGHACASGEMCCSAACAATASCAFAVTGVNPAQGWVSGGDWLTLTGAGFAKGMHVTVGSGRAPARVVDANHAIVLTPPGPAGPADIGISLGGSMAASKGAFKYNTGGLKPPWQIVKMANRRGEHPALAVTQDGRVLVAGGTTMPDIFTTGQASGELFDRPSLTFGTVTNAMGTGRCWDAAVTLLTGKVLVAGACCVWSNPQACSAAASAGADLFDPVANAFTPTQMPLSVGRGAPTLAVLMVDGRVLVVSSNDPSVELYDPDTDSFKLVGHTQLHDGGFLIRLRDGRILLGGGGKFVGSLNDVVEAFDAETETFTPVMPMTTARSYARAVALPDGRALVIGGYGNVAGGILDSIEVFDPVANTFTLAPYKLSGPRAAYAGVLVRDGTILALGGDSPNNGPPTNIVDQIDPVQGTVSAFPSLPTASHERSAIRLLDGSVLLAGGIIADPDAGTVVSSDFIEFLSSDFVQ